jgi:(R,R)-butanediol dehydrogenase / meso-butanediol dehydrogenase / diacetyl reductase
MKAQVFTGLNKMDFLERFISKPQKGELTIKVEYCGICGTDVHSYQNALHIPIGTVMGHECTGTVSETGSGIKNFKIGDRVAINPMPKCGKCYWCERGQFSLCLEAMKREIGFTLDNDGGFAKHIKIRYPDEMLYHLPLNVSFEEGALIEPLAVSLHGIRQSRFKTGDRVLVIGAGMIGLGVLEFLRIGGARQIIVIELSEEKADIALKLGASVVLNPEKEDVSSKNLELTNGIGPDIVFECAGNPATFQNSITYVKRGGQVILAGFCEKDVPINPLKMVLKEAELKAVLGYYDEFPLVIDFLSKKEIHSKDLITSIIPLEDLNEKGFKRIISHPETIRILVKP